MASGWAGEISPHYYLSYCYASIHWNHSFPYICSESLYTSLSLLRHWHRIYLPFICDPLGEGWELSHMILVPCSLWGWIGWYKLAALLLCASVAHYHSWTSNSGKGNKKEDSSPVKFLSSWQSSRKWQHWYSLGTCKGMPSHLLVRWLNISI